MLFLTFFKIGLFTFGGGASMIPLLQQEVISHGWLEEEELLRYIAISESTPGPIAVNMATFIGSSQAGLLGSFCATAGVVLPSFLVILLIASLFKRFSEYRPIRFVLASIRPIVVGMILSSGTLLALSAVGISNITHLQPDVISVGITLFLTLVMLAYRKLFGKPIGVITLILIAAGFGIIAGFI